MRGFSFGRGFFVVLYHCVIYHSAKILTVSNLYFCNVCQERSARKIPRDNRGVYACYVVEKGPIVG
jgi:hypothetical protein